MTEKPHESIGQYFMCLELADLYDALRAADVPDDKARAATAVADFDRRIERIETKLTLMLSLLGVMIAVILGGFYAVWAQLVAMSAKLGA